MRGRYIGSVTTFEMPVGTVHYGDEFDLPPGREKAFLQHGHIEPADKAAKDLYYQYLAPEPVTEEAEPLPTSELDSSIE